MKGMIFGGLVTLVVLTSFLALDSVNGSSYIRERLRRGYVGPVSRGGYDEPPPNRGPPNVPVLYSAPQRQRDEMGRAEEQNEVQGTTTEVSSEESQSSQTPEEGISEDYQFGGVTQSPSGANSQETTGPSFPSSESAPEQGSGEVGRKQTPTTTYRPSGYGYEQSRPNGRNPSAPDQEAVNEIPRNNFRRPLDQQQVENSQHPLQTATESAQSSGSGYGNFFQSQPQQEPSFEQIAALHQPTRTQYEQRQGGYAFQQQQQHQQYQQPQEQQYQQPQQQQYQQPQQQQPQPEYKQQQMQEQQLEQPRQYEQEQPQSQQYRQQSQVQQMTPFIQNRAHSPGTEVSGESSFSSPSQGYAEKKEGSTVDMDLEGLDENIVDSDLLERVQKIIEEHETQQKEYLKRLRESTEDGDEAGSSSKNPFQDSNIYKGFNENQVQSGPSTGNSGDREAEGPFGAEQDNNVNAPDSDDFFQNGFESSAFSSGGYASNSRKTNAQQPGLQGSSDQQTQQSAGFFPTARAEGGMSKSLAGNSNIDFQPAILTSHFEESMSAAQLRKGKSSQEFRSQPSTNQASQAYSQGQDAEGNSAQGSGYFEQQQRPQTQYQGPQQQRPAPYQLPQQEQQPQYQAQSQQQRPYQAPQQPQYQAPQQQERVYLPPQQPTQPQQERVYLPPQQPIQPQQERVYLPPQQPTQPQQERVYLPPQQPTQPQQERVYLPPPQQAPQRQERVYLPPPQQQERVYLPPQQQAQPQQERVYLPPPQQAPQQQERVYLPPQLEAQQRYPSQEEERPYQAQQYQAQAEQRPQQELQPQPEQRNQYEAQQPRLTELREQFTTQPMTEPQLNKPGYQTFYLTPDQARSSFLIPQNAPAPSVQPNFGNVDQEANNIPSGPSPFSQEPQEQMQRYEQPERQEEPERRIPVQYNSFGSGNNQNSFSQQQSYPEPGTRQETNYLPPQQEARGETGPYQTYQYSGEGDPMIRHMIDNPNVITRTIVIHERPVQAFGDSGMTNRAVITAEELRGGSREPESPTYQYGNPNDGNTNALPTAFPQQNQEQSQPQQQYQFLTASAQLSVGNPAQEAPRGLYNAPYPAGQEQAHSDRGSYGVPTGPNTDAIPTPRPVYGIPLAPALGPESLQQEPMADAVVIDSPNQSSSLRGFNSIQQPNEYLPPRRDETPEGSGREVVSTAPSGSWDPNLFTIYRLPQAGQHPLGFTHGPAPVSAPLVSNRVSLPAYDYSSQAEDLTTSYGHNVVVRRNLRKRFSPAVISPLAGFFSTNSKSS